MRNSKEPRILEILHLDFVTMHLRLLVLKLQYLRQNLKKLWSYVCISIMTDQAKLPYHSTSSMVQSRLTLIKKRPVSQKSQNLILVNTLLTIPLR